MRPSMVPTLSCVTLVKGTKLVVQESLLILLRKIPFLLFTLVIETSSKGTEKTALLPSPFSMVVKTPRDSMPYWHKHHLT